jgi:glycosyltransferase involved in cell wall biosynthesis
VWKALPDGWEQYDVVSLRGVRAPHSTIEKMTLYPLRYMLAGLRVLPLLNRYDVVFSWETKCGFAIALYQSLFRRQRPAHVVVGLIYKGIVPHYLAVARRVLASLAGVVCFTEHEAQQCRTMLGMPAERVHSIDLVWDVSEDEGVSAAEWDADSYVLSVGSSNRDYRTLFRAAAQIDARFVVVAHPYNLKGLRVPPNVEVHYDLPSGQVTQLLRRARAVVVPLYEDDYSAGQTVLIRAMSAARAVVVTRTSGVGGYVIDGETAILVRPGNVPDMVEAIERLLRSPEETRRLGIRAREEAVARYGFDTLARYLDDLAHTLTGEADTPTRPTRLQVEGSGS